jgi:hypothetical protein
MKLKLKKNSAGPFVDIVLNGCLFYEKAISYKFYQTIKPKNRISIQHTPISVYYPLSIILRTLFLDKGVALTLKSGFYK